MSDGNDPNVHAIRGGRFVCTAEPSAPCHNYPGCQCEEWSAELHGVTPEPGHENHPQGECWIDPWLTSHPLANSYIEGSCLDDDEFPDGPVTVEWNCDEVLWKYADDTDPHAEEKTP